MPILQRSKSAFSSSTKEYPAVQSFRPHYDPNSSMYKYQNKVQTLPVPTLEETCERYWKSLLPLFKSDEERQRTRNAIDKFLGSSVAAELQQRLLARKTSMDKAGRNWFIDWWNDAAYMGWRDPVVINVNYFFQFADDKRRRNPLLRAASIVDAAMDFRQLCVDQKLDPDTAGRGDSFHGLCMHQYQFMFNACRLPVSPSDQISVHDPSICNHVAVVRKGKFYVFDLVHKNTGARLTIAEIEAQLKHIKKDADVDGFTGHPLGALTTQNRDVWERARKELWNYSPANREALEKLESSVFLLCLDDTSPLTREEVGRALWHGDGKNRWFDKSAQFVVFENGKAGFNGEHSMMDATPTFRLCDYVCEKTFSSAVETASAPKDISAKPEALVFQYPEAFSTYMDNALLRFQSDVDRHDHTVLAFNNYGKNLIKKFGVSPDAFVQLSIQHAFYKLFGESKATYESSQTKKFAWGRTEVTRSLSEDSAAFVRAAENANLSPAKKAELAKKAIKSHSKYMADAVEGKGVDRHFMGLRKLLKAGEQMPEIFTDPLFARSNHWTLSTSQITSEHFDGYGWGEVVPDGYGIAYMIKDGSIHYNIASMKGGPGWENGPGSWKGAGKGIENPCKKMSSVLEESLFELKSYFGALAASETTTKAKL